MELTFRTREGRFNYRVGAIIIHQGKVLMIKNNQVPYFYSVGGRARMKSTYFSTTNHFVSATTFPQNQKPTPQAQ